MKKGPYRRGNLTPAIRRKAHQRSIEVRRQAAVEWLPALMSQIEAIQAEGIQSLEGIAAELNACRIPAARAGQWSAVQVMRVLNAAK